MLARHGKTSVHIKFSKCWHDMALLWHAMALLWHAMAQALCKSWQYCGKAWETLWAILWVVAHHGIAIVQVMAILWHDMANLREIWG